MGLASLIGEILSERDHGDLQLDDQFFEPGAESPSQRDHIRLGKGARRNHHFRVVLHARQAHFARLLAQEDRDQSRRVDHDQFGRPNSS
jgi:hypothetical protein